jgi:two-component system cell cycle sensor histidine kinase/response regulator CckA
MSNRKSSSWFYPNSTANPGRDRNARTLQFSCFLLALAVGAVLLVSAIGREWQETPLLVFAIAGFVSAAVMNRAGRSDWAGRTAFLVVLLSAILLVFQAHDGFRSHSMLVFPGLLLISVMMLDRASYVMTAGIVVVAVAALGIAVKHGLTRATPPVRTTYDSIFYVDLNLLVIAIIGSRIARDTQRNVFDLRAGIDRLSAANLELVQIREDLQGSEERLKSAQRLTHVGSWHWNLGTDQVVCSEECKRIFGQPEDYAPSLEGLLQIITPLDRERVANEVQRGIAEKSGCSTEFRVVRPNGELRTVTFNSQVVLDEEGSPRHIFGACQDVTDDRRAQEEALARQKLESLGVLAGGIAHDFNNLLAGILAEAELVEDDLPAGSSVGQEIEKIKRVAIRGAEIVRELMIYAGHDQTHLIEPLDLSELMEDMLELLKVSISKHALLKTDLDQNLPAVWGNAPQIRRAVMNLVINASEAIGEKEGVIQISTSRVTVGEDSIVINAPNLPTGEYVQLEVSDTGCGMTEEARARIFDPFFTTKFAGRGLGLAVVQGIVRDLGGVVEVVSVDGQGATFRVLLPCTSKRDLRTQSASTSSSAEQSNARVGTVLVVEDEEVIRLAISKALRKKAISVMEASDGSAAMDLIRTHKDDIDVILLDVTLPGRSSREVFEEAQRLRPDLKMILTSAYAKKTVDAAFAGLRVEHFIRKPFQLRDLMRLLRGTLSV